MAINIYTDAQRRRWVAEDSLPRVQVHVLSRNVHEQIRKMFPVIAVNNETSAMQAGYQLGIAKVLDVLLKEGFLQELS